MLENILGLLFENLFRQLCKTLRQNIPKGHNKEHMALTFIKKDIEMTSIEGVSRESKLENVGKKLFSLFVRRLPMAYIWPPETIT